MPQTSRGARRPLVLASVVGARPQFVKAAVISRAVAVHNSVRPSRPVKDVLIHTGQHYDDAMSRIFFEQMEIPAPHYHLGVGSASHGRQTGLILARLEAVLKELGPDIVLVHGDTNSTLAGALAAAKLGIPVAHGEAGLRSFNRAMPEEINRVLTDHVSAWLFCPTAAAVRNCGREGLQSAVRLVGDVMFDAFLWYRKKALRESRIIEGLEVRPGRYALATIHRPENTDRPDRLRGLLSALSSISEHHCPVVLPLHPRTRKALARLRPPAEFGPAVILTDPLPYFDMLALTARARVVLTDSGGLQKEAFFAGVPGVTLRGETEWTETVKAGRNVLAGADPLRIAAAVDKALKLGAAPDLHPYGRGKAGLTIIRTLVREFTGR
jgi:UDP-GlcNAc3NAcA epimerase